MRPRKPITIPRVKVNHASFIIYASFIPSLFHSSIDSSSFHYPLLIRLVHQPAVMPPKRKSVKRKISTPAVPAVANSRESVPAKKQKLVKETGLEVTGRTRSTRSGTQLPESSSGEYVRI